MIKELKFAHELIRKLLKNVKIGKITVACLFPEYEN